MLGKIGIGILAGTLTFGGGGAAVAAHQLGATGNAADRQARCEAFQQQFAQDLGISTQKLQDTRKQALLQVIDQQLAAGKLTPDQAQKARDKVNNSPGDCSQVGQHAAAREQVGKAELQAVAKQMNITEKQLVQEVRGGKSLAQVAQAHNVSRDQLKATLHDTFKAELDKAVAAGKITQDQANTALARFDGKLDTIVDHVGGTKKAQ